MKFEVIRCLLRREEGKLQNHQNLRFGRIIETIRTGSHSTQLSCLFLKVIFSSCSNLQGHGSVHGKVCVMILFLFLF